MIQLSIKQIIVVLIHKYEMSVQGNKFSRL